MIRLELGLLLRDRAAVAVSFVFLVLAVVSSLVSARHVRVHSDALETARVLAVGARDTARAALPEDTSAPLAARDSRDPAFVGRELGALAPLAPAPLASVSHGLRDTRPQVFRVTTGPLESAALTATAPMRGPSRDATGPFDPAFVFVVLFPLVAIALSYDLLSGERERGTLALLLSQPVTQRQLVASKAAARGLLLGATGLVAAAAGALVAGDALFTSMGAVYAAGIAAYALFWFALAIAVNSRGWSSAQNALVLVGAWLLLVVIVPGLLRAFVEARYPPPSRVELVNEAREAAEEAEAELGAIVGTHGTATPPNATQRAAAVQEELARRTEPVIAAFRQQRDLQQATVESFQVASPAIVLQELFNDVAGTGARRQQVFEDAVDRFHREWRAWFVAAKDRHLTAVDYAGLPAFSSAEPPGALQASLWRLAILMVPGLILLAAALPGLRRIGRLA